ncbi:hypothetical protein Ccrd_002339 [Cynara cardunculus var. scolymus]|uniref:RING-type E3 ubiquitin transferase n=1 Tax=Cynara cardunculus var. scolymus TaxID=59895 RepID=A0A124SD27_CYNCS|nr:hypothetical protein Ccrd_002339 [Cynara cardunculus var. scolymus]
MDETERPRPKGAKPIKKSKISRNPLLKESKNESGKWEWQMKASILQCAYDSRSLAKLQVQRKSSQFHLIGRIIRIKIRWVFMFTEGRMNNKVIGVAIDKDKGSQSALKWTADNLLGKGQIVYLLHVKIKHSVPFSSSVSFAQKPNKMSDLHPDDSLMIDADSQLRELFLPFRCFCTRKEIKSHEVVLEDTDVVKALVEFVTRSIIEVLVIGAPAKGGLLKSPFNNRRGPNGKPYGELTPPESDISFVSSGRPSVDNFNMFPSFDSEMNARISFSELEQDSYQMGRRSADINTSPDLTSFDSPRASLSSNAEDVEAEMRRLKLELTKTMEMYSSACKEALTAKQKAMELQRWKLEEQQKVEEARVAEESVEKEKAKTKTATEAAEAAQRIAELESQKRVVAEKSALRESSENNAGLMSFSRYRRYTIDEIEEATEYFSATRRIGEGGYGPVYKCHLDHTPVAVKVLRPDAAQGRLQFQQEVEVLCCIRHPHMVLLLGACPEYGCLVYEYMSNGSLEDCLLRKNKIPPLSWQHRFRITAEICSGLLFLHQTKPEPIVHRDLKPANILLDRNFVSKIADVGLARLVPASVQDSVTQYRMTSAAGTFCYIDPEYQQTGMLGVKSDVYSLGVMFLQIITAKPPMALTHHVDRAIKNGTFAEMLDPAVPDWPVEEALGLAKLSLHCAELRRKDRPDLGKIVMPELERLRTLADESVQYSIFSPASQVS